MSLPVASVAGDHDTVDRKLLKYLFSENSSITSVHHQVRTGEGYWVVGGPKLTQHARCPRRGIRNNYLVKLSPGVIAVWGKVLVNIFEKLSDTVCDLE